MKTRPRTPRRGAAALLLCAGAAGWGCAHEWAAGPGAGASSAPGDAAALLPVALAVHPLTRVGADPQGQPALIVHAELQDRFEQSAKALGAFRIELYRPAGLHLGEGDLRADPAAEVQELVWDVDLTDPDRNALAYDDLVTRTYTLVLGGLPEWMLRWSRQGDGEGPWIRVSFTPYDGSGRVLSERFRVVR